MMTRPPAASCFRTTMKHWKYPFVLFALACLPMVCAVIYPISALGRTPPPAHSDDRQDINDPKKQQLLQGSRDIYIIRINALSGVEAAVLGQQRSFGPPTTRSRTGTGGRFSPDSQMLAAQIAVVKQKVGASLTAALGPQAVAKLNVISYGVTFPGAAVGPLTATQVLQLKKNRDIASVMPNKLLKAATISTPGFLDMDAPGGAWSAMGGVDSAGEDVTIGIIDSGIWPELDAFSDRKGFNSNGTGEYAYGPPPSKFKGSCQPGVDPVEVPCNRKVIGCRWYTAGLGGDDVIRKFMPDEPLSCRTRDDHGTHVASTAGGNHAYGCGSNILPGKASMSGMAPRARLAIYKVFWGGYADWADIVSAIEDAVLDGVDVINVSLGGESGDSPAEHPMLLALKNAAGAGIFVAAAAGNDGPYFGSTANNVPWVTQVAASSHHRRDTSDRVVLLGDGQNIKGAGYSTTPVGPLPFLLGHQASLPGADVEQAMLCADGTLDPAKASGKIIACNEKEFSYWGSVLGVAEEVKRAGGVAMLLLEHPSTYYSWVFQAAVPTVWITANDSSTIRAYAATPNATAALLVPSLLDLTAPAPVVADFSARGPAIILDYETYEVQYLDMVAPDITAPGTRIYAAIPPDIYDPTATCAVLSGTSMSTPHIAGIAALIKQKHPAWSAAAIKSAIMTTAYNTFKTGVNAGRQGIGIPFDVGAGHVNPSAALNPGLVFDWGLEDSNRWLCGVINSREAPGSQNSSSACTSCGADDNSNCAMAAFNVPSIGMFKVPGTTTITRVVTSVLPVAATWTASNITSPSSFNIQVSPLSFTLAAGESKSLSITVRRSGSAGQQPAAQLQPQFHDMDIKFGSITWTSSNNLSARIPLALKAVEFKVPQEIRLDKRDSNGRWPSSTSYPVTVDWDGSFFSLAASLSPPFKMIEGTLKEIPSGMPYNGKEAIEGGYVAAIPFTINKNGPSFYRFALFDEDMPDDNAEGVDLDLILTIQIDDGWSETYAESIGSTSSEEITLRSPENAKYVLYVYPWTVPGGTTKFKLYMWSVQLQGPVNQVRMTSTPNGGRPAKVTAGQQVDTSLQFVGRRLSTDTRYLGLVKYGGRETGNAGQQGPAGSPKRINDATLVYLV